MTNIIVDTCCLVNLWATGKLRLWLCTTEWKPHVPVAVLKEALFLRETDEKGNPLKRKLEIESEAKAGSFELVDVGGVDELNRYVALAGELDDGEAMALAIAAERKWELFTDDKKAIRLASQCGVTVLTTPVVLKRASECMKIDDADMRAAIARIENMARYSPPANETLRDWWHGKH